jgi:hypothetical protein
MAKRKTFYVSAAIFELPLSAYAIAVYTYLSFCADRQGSCFPSIPTIAERCGMSRTTVKKAKDELKQAGLIRTEKAYMPCTNGKRRQSANRYRLLTIPHQSVRNGMRDDRPTGRETTCPRSCDDRPSGRETAAPRSCGDREINNNSKNTIDDVPSVSHNGEETDGLTELNAILEKLELNLFLDRTFAVLVEQTIRQMYFAPYLKTDGRRVPRDEVRKRLSMLTINHIDFVEKQLDERFEEVTEASHYLAVCIYHAPIDCYIKGIRDANAPY